MTTRSLHPRRCGKKELRSESQCSPGRGPFKRPENIQTRILKTRYHGEAVAARAAGQGHMGSDSHTNSRLQAGCLGLCLIGERGEVPAEQSHDSRFPRLHGSAAPGRLGRAAPQAPLAPLAPPLGAPPPGARPSRDSGPALPAPRPARRSGGSACPLGVPPPGEFSWRRSPTSGCQHLSRSVASPAALGVRGVQRRERARARALGLTLTYFSRRLSASRPVTSADPAGP